MKWCDQCNYNLCHDCFSKPGSGAASEASADKNINTAVPLSPNSSDGGDFFGRSQLDALRCPSPLSTELLDLAAHTEEFMDGNGRVVRLPEISC